MNHGYELEQMREGVKPFRLYYFPTLKSTNSHAAVMRRRGDLFGPAVVVAGRQTLGRGRGGNRWFSGGENLTVTFVMPVEEELLAHQLPLVAGLAVREAAERWAGVGRVGIKWPNDVVVVEDGKLLKLAGLLCERVDGVDLVGVGMNVNLDSQRLPKELRGRVTSLGKLAQENVALGSQRGARGRQQAIDLTEVLIHLAGRVAARLEARRSLLFPAFLEELRRHDALAGRRVRILGNAGENPITGRCAGIDEMGRLLVREGRRTRPVMSGHVELFDHI